MTDDTETNAPEGRSFERPVRPRFWMDDRGLVVTDKWLQSDKATSDYRSVYNIPVRRRRSGGYSLACEYCAGNDETPPEHTHDCSRPNTEVVRPAGSERTQS